MPSALRPLLPPHGPASWLSWVVGLWVFLAEGLGLQAGLGGPWCRGGNLLQEEPDGRQGQALCRQRRLGSSEKADRGPDLGLESSPLSYVASYLQQHVTVSGFPSTRPEGKPKAESRSRCR